RPRPGRLCDWCDHQARCPEFGGTPPPYPLMIQPRLPEPRTEAEGPGESAVEA
ncbi:MAG: recombinase RecB, partial [Streptomyces sp.]